MKEGNDEYEGFFIINKQVIKYITKKFFCKFRGIALKNGHVVMKTKRCRNREDAIEELYRLVIESKGIIN